LVKSLSLAKWKKRWASDPCFANHPELEERSECPWGNEEGLGLSIENHACPDLLRKLEKHNGQMHLFFEEE
jgi:hypothetical protein